MCLLMMMECQAANTEQVQALSLIIFSTFGSMLGNKIAEADTNQPVFGQMLAQCVCMCAQETVCARMCKLCQEVHMFIKAPISVLSLFVCVRVCVHFAQCVREITCSVAPSPLPLSSHVYLERSSSEIKGQKQRVVCSFISAPSDGGWRFLQLTPPSAIIVLRMCVVCVFPLTLDLLLFLIYPMVIFFLQLDMICPLPLLTLQ